MARFLTADPVGKLGLAVLSPDHVEATMSRWRSERASPALVWARWAVLRSTLSWAAAGGVIRSNPLEVMEGPPRPQPRKHLLPAEVAGLLATVSRQVAPGRRRVSGETSGRPVLEALVDKAGGIGWAGSW